MLYTVLLAAELILRNNVLPAQCYVQALSSPSLLRRIKQRTSLFPKLPQPWISSSPTSPMLMQYTSSEEAGISNRSNKRNNKNKKRRFLQQAHPQALAAKPKRNTKAFSPGRKESIGDNIHGGEVVNKAIRPPLQDNKSIEELEAILEKRWGTSTTKAKASNRREGTGADFVLSFENDNYKYEGGSNNGESMIRRNRQSRRLENDGWGTGLTRNSAGSGTKASFRSKRVIDPWAKEEGIYDRQHSSHNDSRNVEDDNWENKRSNKHSNNKGSFKEDALLHRVRSNQARLKKERGDRFGGPSSAESKNKQKKKDSNAYLNVPIDAFQEYYDEDDEGYESYGRGDSLISPHPVGSQGKFSNADRITSKSSSLSSLSSGIFAPRQKQSADDKPRKRVGGGDGDDSSKISQGQNSSKRPKRTKRKEPILPPMLDHDGNEMFLTLEQADRIVQHILSSSLHATNKIDTDDDDDVAYNGRKTRITEWEELGITNPTLLSNLRSRSKLGCPTPLSVQEKACPALVSGNDVLISTHTGSGKTLAFLAPLAQNLLLDNVGVNSGGSGKGPASSNAYPRAIVIAPGRELASQIVSVAQTLFQDTGLKTSLAIGGTPYSRNVERIRKTKPDVIVGTPGRIAELVVGRVGDKGGKLKISGLQTIVLDEFDALLQYDAHKEPTQAIMEAIYRQHGLSLQRVLCSATAADMMMTTSPSNKKEDLVESVSSNSAIDEYLRPGYAHASVDDDDILLASGSAGKTTLARVSKTTIHGVIHVPHRRLALDAVRRILNTDPLPQQVLIFVDSPRRVEIVIEKLANMDIIAAPLHGGASNTKNDRAEVNKALREGYVGIVVATEMAARGIDAPYLTHVINLDLPTDSSHYAHRAGRCGRGGRAGVVVNLTCGGRERGVPKRMAEELGVTMHNVEAREGKLRIVQG